MTGKFGHIRPAFVHERRWFGGRPFSTGVGASLSWAEILDSKTQIELNGSRVRQEIKSSGGQDAWRSSVALEISRTLSGSAGARLTIRYAGLDAQLRAQSLRQVGAGMLLAKRFDFASLFGQIDYTRTQGLEPIFLFAKTRHENRIDLAAGAVFQRILVGGFSPLVRITHSTSNANISIYEY